MSWERYLKKGRLQYQAGMLDYAIYNLAQCLDANPGCQEAATMLASIYVKKNKKLRAIDYYERSLEIEEGQAEVHFALGELYEFFIERERAFRHYVRCVEIDPGHVRGHASLVRHYLNRNDRASADRHFQTSYRLAKERSGALFERAVDADRKGKYGQALDLYGMVIDEAPSLIEAYIGLYEVNRKLKNFAAAAAALERLAIVKPDNEKTYILLAYIYFTQKLPGNRKNQIDRAIDNLKRVIELNPDNYEAYISLSEIYAYMGMDIEAHVWEKRGFEVEKRVRGGK